MMVVKTVCDHVEGLQPLGALLGEEEEPRSRPALAG
jgi:hypothetical protein